MKTIVIVGGTREAAYKKLEETVRNDGIVRHEWFREATMDGYRLLAVGGEPEDVCFLVASGYNHISEIIIVNGDGISEKMWGEIRFVRSAKKEVV